MEDLARAHGRLRFADDAIERRYRRELVAELKPYIVLGHLVAVGAWVFGAIVLSLVLESGLQDALIRLAIGGGTLTIAAIVVHTRTLHHGSLIAIVCGANVVAGTMMVDLGHEVLGMPVVGYIGVVMTLFYVTTIYRIPLVPCVLTTAPYVVLELVALANDRSGATLVIESSMLLIGEAFGLASAVLSEIHARTAFVQRTVIARQQAALDEERAKSERLLRNVLPEAIAARLKGGEESIADGLDEVTILFADLVGFTTMAADRPATEVVTVLSRLFSELDELARKHGLEKIKTIGDAYMAAAGVPAPRQDHADAAARMALDTVEVVERVSKEIGMPLQIRIGLHSGPVVAGVIGRHKFAYDLWGDSVNTAARMESHGLPDEIQVSDETRKRLNGAYAFEPREGLEVKGKGIMRTWLLRRVASS